MEIVGGAEALGADKGAKKSVRIVDLVEAS